MEKFCLNVWTLPGMQLDGMEMSRLCDMTASLEVVGASFFSEGNLDA